jgi:hypothetical protein
MLVNDCDPPHAASARLPEPEANLDPAVVRAKAKRRGGTAPANAGDTHFVTPASAVIVAASLCGSGREGEQEQRQ